MTASFLSEFSTQIAVWTQAIIDDGRFPFRRAEIYAQPLVSLSAAPPTMVLWINRDSFMAGGVLIFTDAASATGDAVGPEIATGLGLSHYTVWGRSQITFWQCANGEPVIRKHLPVALPAKPAPRDFQALLLRILQELKLLCVTAALPSSALSAAYFANIFHATVTAALPALGREHRLLQAGKPQQHFEPVERAAEQKVYLSLLRLVALSAFDRLPPAVQPEGLEQASRFALETLPPSVHLPLAIGPEEAPLGGESAIRFHQLFRRLTQLGIADDRERIAQALELLLPSCATRFQGFPLPLQPSADAAQTTLLLNPDHPGGELKTVEVVSPPLGALFAVMRILRNTPPPQQQITTPLRLGAELNPAAISGTLYDTHVPTGHARLILNTRLRTSWPGRRWGLPAGTPLWVWEFLHLCGIAASRAQIDLALPGGWLGEPFAQPLLEMLFDDLTVEQFASISPSGLKLRLRKQPATSQTIVTLSNSQHERFLPQCFFEHGRSSMLALALALPPEIFALLLDGTLQPDRPDAWSHAQRRGLELFCRSSLGGSLWELVAPGRPLPGGEAFPARLAERGMPLPTGDILSQLATKLPSGPDFPTATAIDRELGRWFDLPISAFASTSVYTQKLRRQHKVGNRAADTVAGRVAREVFRDGIPRFPEHYLLDHFRPATCAYELSGPLAIRTTFFDTVVLEDANGRELEVEGLETAHALVMASHCHRGAVSLPVDRQLTATILARYLHDLHRLQLHLRQQVYLEVADPRQADALCNKIWNLQALPPATLLDR